MRKTALLLCVVLFAAACTDKFEKRQFYAMGTLVEITHKKDAGLKQVIRTINEYEEQVKSFENEYNNAPAGSSFPINPLWEVLFKKSYDYKALSKDRFDIRAMSLTSLYGFPEGSFDLPSPEKYAAAVDAIKNKPLLFVDGKLVKEDERLKISVGAFAKGMIVDKAVEVMKKNGAESGIVNAGGDLYAFGKKNKSRWRVGIRHPDDASKVISTIAISDKAVATSGDYERFFMKNGIRYSHIFDMTTMEPASLYRSVSVIADNCETADGLSTVFFLLPETDAAEVCKRTGTPVLIYTHDGRLIKLCGWESFEN